MSQEDSSCLLFEIGRRYNLLHSAVRISAMVIIDSFSTDIVGYAISMTDFVLD